MTTSEIWTLILAVIAILISFGTFVFSLYFAFRSKKRDSKKDFVEIVQLLRSEKNLEFYYDYIEYASPDSKWKNKFGEDWYSVSVADPKKLTKNIKEFERRYDGYLQILEIICFMYHNKLIDNNDIEYVYELKRTENCVAIAIYLVLLNKFCNKRQSPFPYRHLYDYLVSKNKKWENLIIENINHIPENNIQKNKYDTFWKVLGRFLLEKKDFENN